MIVDTSALLAVLLNEPDRSVFQRAILGANEAAISVAAYVEAGMVATGRTGTTGIQDLANLCRALHIVKMDLRAQHAELALEAFTRYGKGMGHPAQLNFGDCFSYALAKALNAPLLYKGDDFAKTDVRPAL